MQLFNSYASAGRPNGKLLERLVAAMQGAYGKDVIARWDEVINGRQFDVALRFKKGPYEYLTLIECKALSRAVSVEKVDAFVTKAKDAGANKLVMVSTGGYQSGAIEVASRHGVMLLTLSEKVELPAGHRLVGRSVSSAFDRLSFKNESTGFRFEAPAGTAKFGYLWRNVRVAHEKQTLTALEWLERRYPSLASSPHPTKRQDYRINFAGGAELLVPFEESHVITSMAFSRSPYDVPIWVGPSDNLDPFMVQRQSLKFTVHDADGKLVDEQAISSIPFGFDQVLTEGRYYYSPSMGFNYYLQKIEGKILSWILLESYQHGSLIQAEFTQNMDQISGEPTTLGGHTYVEIDDGVELARLKRMLDALDLAT